MTWGDVEQARPIDSSARTRAALDGLVVTGALDEEERRAYGDFADHFERAWADGAGGVPSEADLRDPSDGRRRGHGGV